MTTEASDVRTVLIVCTGNVCRSPMAVGLLRARLSLLGLAGRVRVTSAGTYGLDGSPASPNAVSVLHDLGIDIEDHRARTLSQRDIEDATLVLTMTVQQLVHIRQRFDNFEGKVYLLSQMVGQGIDIEDPYGLPKRAYAICAEQLSKIIEGGFERIVSLLLAPPEQLRTTGLDGSGR